MKQGRDSLNSRPELLSMGDDGELKILEMKQEESTQLAVVDDQVNTSLMETFREDYDALNDNPSDYVRDLVGADILPVKLHNGEQHRQGVGSTQL